MATGLGSIFSHGHPGMAFTQGWQSANTAMEGTNKISEWHANAEVRELQRQLLEDELQTQYQMNSRANQAMREIDKGLSQLQTADGMAAMYKQLGLTPPGQYSNTLPIAGTEGSYSSNDIIPGVNQAAAIPVPAGLNLGSNGAFTTKLTPQEAMNDLIRQRGTSLYDLRKQMNSDDRFLATLANQQAMTDMRNEHAMSMQELRMGMQMAQLEARLAGKGLGGSGSGSSGGQNGYGWGKTQVGDVPKIIKDTFGYDPTMATPEQQQEYERMVAAGMQALDEGKEEGFAKFMNEATNRRYGAPAVQTPPVAAPAVNKPAVPGAIQEAPAVSIGSANGLTPSKDTQIIRLTNGDLQVGAGREAIVLKRGQPGYKEALAEIVRRSDPFTRLRDSYMNNWNNAVRTQ